MMPLMHFFSFSVKFLEVIKPFCSILPEIAKPERKVYIFYISLNDAYYCIESIYIKIKNSFQFV